MDFEADLEAADRKNSLHRVGKVLRVGKISGILIFPADIIFGEFEATPRLNPAQSKAIGSLGKSLRSFQRTQARKIKPINGGKEADKMNALKSAT